MNLNHITVPSLDLTRSVPFYQKLGLKLIVDSVPNYARFECPLGSSTLSIHQTNQLPSGDGIWVYFEVDNLDEYVLSLQEERIVFEELPNNKRWLWREARLKDPDGNQIILFFVGENRLNPPWKVKSGK